MVPHLRLLVSNLVAVLRLDMPDLWATGGSVYLHTTVMVKARYPVWRKYFKRRVEGVMSSGGWSITINLRT